MAPKRASYDIRRQHQAQGAILIKVDHPDESWHPKGSLAATESALSREMALKGSRVQAADLENRCEQYRVVERKGFRITTDTGCFIPDSFYCTKQEGAALKAYQRSIFCFAGVLPKQYGPGEPEPTNERGLAAGATLSHLCHRRYCCRPDHLVIEPRWRNYARNGCLGTMPNPFETGKTTCGCMLQFIATGSSVQHGPPCLRAYHPSEEAPPHSIDGLAESEEAAADVLDKTSFPFPYSFVDYVARDTLNQARNEKRAEKEKRKLAVDLQDSSPVVKRRLERGLPAGIQPLDDLPISSKHPAPDTLTLLADDDFEEEPLT